MVYDAAAHAVGGLLARCIWAETGNSARFVHGPGDGGTLGWPDLDWSVDPDAVLAELTDADIVLVVGSVRPEHEDVVRRRAHLRLRPAGPGPELRVGTAVAPVPLPLWSQRFNPEERDGVLTILLTDGSPHRASLRRLVENAAEVAGTPVRVVDTTCDPVTDVLKLGGRADVVLDPSTTGPWTWSLAGLARAGVVVNAFAASSEGTHRLRDFAAVPGTPFEHAGAGRLAHVLARLMSTDRAELAERGAANRRWMERHWAFTDQWDQWWSPALHASIAAHAREVGHG